MVDPSPPADAAYRWITACFTNNIHRDQTCFPTGQITQSVTANNLLAEDAGSIFCRVTIGSSDFVSDLFKLRISGIKIFAVTDCKLYYLLKLG